MGWVRVFLSGQQQIRAFKTSIGVVNKCKFMVFLLSRILFQKQKKNWKEIRKIGVFHAL